MLSCVDMRILFKHRFVHNICGIKYHILNISNFKLNNHIFLIFNTYNIINITNISLTNIG